MKRLLTALLILSLAVPAFASGVEGADVKNVSGTIASMMEGVVGRLDTAAGNALVFEHGGSRVEIAYASIQRFHYTQPLARRLGVRRNYRRRGRQTPPETARRRGVFSGHRRREPGCYFRGLQGPGGVRCCCAQCASEPSGATFLKPASSPRLRGA